MKAPIRLLALYSILSTPSLFADIEIYKIDPVHSSITFKIQHFFSHVSGSFTSFSGTLHYDPSNPSNNYAEGTIDARSINTHNTKRDDHLNKDDFLHTEKYPSITFQTTHWKPNGENRFEVTGNLKIQETTLPVKLDTTFLGSGDGPNNTYLSGWSATTELSRSAFGIPYGKPTIGDIVSVEISIEAQRIEKGND